jgi:hypothetical protein
MAAMVNYAVLLAEISKIFFSEPTYVREILHRRNIHYIALNKVIVLFVYLNSNMAAITGQSFLA